MTGAIDSTTLLGRRATTIAQSTIPSAAHRSAVPRSLSETPPSISHRGGGGSWSSGNGDVHGKAETGLAERSLDSHRERRDSMTSGAQSQSCRRDAACAPAKANGSIHDAPPAPSPLRRRERRASDSGTSVGAAVPATVALSSSCSSSSPLRHLRTPRCRSPEITPEVAAGTGNETILLGVGGGSCSSVTSDKTGQTRASRGESLEMAITRQKACEIDEQDSLGESFGDIATQFFCVIVGCISLEARFERKATTLNIL